MYNIYNCPACNKCPCRQTHPKAESVGPPFNLRAMHPIPGGDTNLLQSCSTKFTSSPSLIIPHSSLFGEEEQCQLFRGAGFRIGWKQAAAACPCPVSTIAPQTVHVATSKPQNLSVCPLIFSIIID